MSQKIDQKKMDSRFRCLKGKKNLWRVDFPFSNNIEGSIFHEFLIILSKFPFFGISHNFEESISWAAERLIAHEIGRLWPTPPHKTSSRLFLLKDYLKFYTIKKLWPTPPHKTSSRLFLVKDYLNFTPLKDYTMKLYIQRHHKKVFQILSQWYIYIKWPLIRYTWYIFIRSRVFNVSDVVSQVNALLWLYTFWL